jgi:serine protease
MKKLLFVIILISIPLLTAGGEACYYYGKTLTCLKERGTVLNSMDKSFSFPLTGEIGLVFKNGTGTKKINEVIRKYSFKIARTLDGIDGYYIFKAPAGIDLFKVSRELFESGLVKWAQPVWLEKPVLTFVPNDTYYPDQWQHSVVNSERAWDIAKGYPDAKIAVVDSGVDTKHPDLFLQLGMSFVPGEPQIDPSMGTLQNKYYFAHGTAVSGIAAGQGDNGFGVAGVCLKCSVIPIKYIGNEMSNPPLDRKLNAIKWAVDAGAWVINNSWTIAPDKDKQTDQCIDIPLDNFVKEMTDYAVNTGRNGLGTIIVWAAGNSACDTVRNPSLFDERTVVVSGLDVDNTLVYYSNYGRNVDIAAPAGDSMPEKSGLITTDVTQNGKGFNPAFNNANPDYSDYMDQAYTKYFDGTSAAAPVVAGALALMLSINPSMTYAEAIECMKKAASVPAADCSYGEKSICFGAGILDAGKMVELASGGECGGEPLEVEDDEKIPDENIENPDNGTDQESPDDNEQIETPDSSPVVDKDEISDSSDINEQSDNAPIPEDESTGCSVIAL